jgi:uncharacterized damage-inducible protein DinB
MFAPLFEYKAWANARMLEALLAIDGECFPEQRRKAIRVMNHTLVVDRIFAAHLLGEPNPHAATNTDETPGLPALTESIRASDAWLAGYARELPVERMGERIRFHFTDGQAGEMSRAEMLQHLIVHGAYHRGAVGQILDALALPRPADTINVYLHAAEPWRREHGSAA